LPLELGQSAKCTIKIVTENLRIGDIAARCGVTRDTIRFYERAGLLQAPNRTASHHRVYDSKTVEQIRFVRQLQSCGLTIGDIQQLVELNRGDTSAASRRLGEILRFRLEFIERRITELENCRTHLTDAMQRCAKARSNGFAALKELPDHDGSPAFAFGRRGMQ
jgi:DNA-binding transcriptional MerR regulator